MNPYFEQMILSASPIELVRLMYQRAIACVADARDHLKAGRIRERSQAINRTYAILTELLTSLDADKAPELAANLRGLYCYMQQRLIDANFQQKDEPLAETGRLLSTLADAWMEVPPELSGSRTAPADYEDAASCLAVVS
jgi:flagellar protein FliS